MGYPNLSYCLMRAVYPVFRLLFPNQEIRATIWPCAMVDVAFRGRHEHRVVVLENREIRATVESLHLKQVERSRSQYQ
jgi:hypothetical protein